VFISANEDFDTSLNHETILEIVVFTFIRSIIIISVRFGFDLFFIVIYGSFMLG